MNKIFFIGLIAILCTCASKPAANAGMDLDTAIREAAAQIETGIPSRTMVALVSVASPSTAFSTQVLTRLESAIVGGRKLIVVDRANLDKIREEQGIQLSGEVDDESAKRIGQFLGAGAIVTGSLTDLGDVYSLSLKAINIETATVAVSYIADLAKTTRIETLLAVRDGAGSGETSTAAASRPASTAQAVPAQPVAPAQPAAPLQLATPPLPAYKIGDTGPAGGIIFFDQGNSSGGWRFMEAAPVDLGPAVFATETYTHQEIQHFGFLSGSNERRSRALGTGATNTMYLMRVANNKGGGFGWAVQLAATYQLNGFNDWFLPSQDELGHMYGNLHMRGLGNFRSERYWSSSMATYRDNSWTGVQYTNFVNGEVNTAWNQSGSWRGIPWTNYLTTRYLVRPVRRF
ncbi:MAG: hypothetical protein FWD40_11080 [Treponema sp.]|nr:hypothetical protein [Treponema sp.]